MKIDIATLRPLHSDIIVEYYDINNLTGSPILIEDRSDNTNTHFVKVLRVGPDVVNIKPGDIILINWLDVTAPFYVDIDDRTSKVFITEESKVRGIVIND